MTKDGKIRNNKKTDLGTENSENAYQNNTTYKKMEPTYRQDEAKQ